MRDFILFASLIYGAFGQDYNSYGSSSLVNQTSGLDDVCNPTPTKLTFPTPNEGCFPNIMKHAAQVNPLARMGHFFEYASRADDTQSYNAEFDNSLVCDGSVYFPGTHVPAIHWSQKYRYITLANDASPVGSGYGNWSRQRAGSGRRVTCNYDYSDIIGGYDGRDFYNVFDPTTEYTDPQPSVYYLLFVRTGSRGFEIQYKCAVPSEKTSVCDKVLVFVNTRVNPSKLSRHEQYEIDEIIDRTLAPYCMSKDDLQKVIHRAHPSIVQCNTGPPVAFLSLVKGYATALPERKLSDARY